jgi:hypothetical protein
VIGPTEDHRLPLTPHSLRGASRYCCEDIDLDVDRIAAVTGQACEWIVPVGSADSTDLAEEAESRRDRRAAMRRAPR